MIKKKLRAGMAAFCIGALALGGSQFVANASEITSGTWGVYYHSPASASTSDTVVLTATRGKTFTAKCNSYSGSIKVVFSNTYLSSQNTVFTSTGTRKFTFANSVGGTTQRVAFKIQDVGSHTGTAYGSAYRN